MPQIEEPADAIQFPYMRDGELVNIKYRSQGKAFRMVSGAEKILYNLDNAGPDKVIVCEGEMDVLSLHEAGIRGSVSVPNVDG